MAAIMAYMIIYHFLSLATQVKIALENSLYNFLSQASQVIIALDNSLEAEFITICSSISRCIRMTPLLEYYIVRDMNPPIP